jgi:ATP-binding cassette subfamily B protein
VKSLPHGLGSEINPKTELSGGQGQRLALARAVARGSVLLILDETTSSLDENLETQIASNLAKLDCGVIIATHRLGPLQICTRTIEFDDGVITFDGPTNIYLQKRQRIGCEE